MALCTMESNLVNLILLIVKLICLSTSCLSYPVIRGEIMKVTQDVKRCSCYKCKRRWMEAQQNIEWRFILGVQPQRFFQKPQAQSEPVPCSRAQSTPSIWY